VPLSPVRLPAVHGFFIAFSVAYVANFEAGEVNLKRQIGVFG
jgi:hypothetical protein